jgi:hypothetical protein
MARAVFVLPAARVRAAVEAFNGKSAWRDDKDGLRTLTGSEHARALATGAYRSGRFLTYKKDKTRLHLVGRETVEGRPAYAVEVTTNAGVSRKVVFDAQTFLILGEDQPRDDGREEILFGDYHTVDGVPQPRRIRIRRGGETLNLTVEEAVHNERAAASLFDFPRRGETPFPDVAALFKEIIAKQEELEKIRDQYAYTRTETDLELDDRGRLAQKRERTYEVFHADGESVETLVATNGQALADDEARKERERVLKRMRERQEKKSRRVAEKKKDGDDQDLTLLHILRVCQFVNPRRERFRGRDLLIYDFEARPGEKPRNRGESWVRKLEGNVWIDEEAKEVVRAEARTNDSIKMAGGLVLSLQPGASFVIEQERMNGEVWLPSYLEVNAAARVLLVKGFKIRQTQRFSDYKKFGVWTSSEIAPPAAAAP